ncbi:hypothetical protein OG520_20815 [Streptomyces sp. NBC_00984]|uniref:hypothetical protein n=1 Tax=Streptomyces sp. NBC_00984 TaxID=2903700 RepID=UPI00386816EC|nr:hypothetical protein OG520_20815 [Streptomyces sp. NBC_00984]
MVERSVLTQEAFEDLARHALRVEEAPWLEFLDGQPVFKTRPYGSRGRIIEWLTHLCVQAEQDNWLFATQGLHIETYRKGGTDSAVPPFAVCT